jgi:hypothetical protein
MDEAGGAFVDPGMGTTAPDGPGLFARYALGPNRLGLCGPDDWVGLLELGSRGRRQPSHDRALRQLARGFEGAWPYLELIAASADIDDPLDARVVSAYWLGTPLERAVDGAAFHESLRVRFRSRTAAPEWPWLAAKPAAGAVPVHAFHVLDVLPRAGLLRGGQVDDVLTVMDSCRIRWGRVTAVEGEHLRVNAVPLELVDGRLRLGAARAEVIRRSADGHGFAAAARPGDVVSIHWDWVCDRLDDAALRTLVTSTQRQIQLTNETI